MKEGNLEKKEDLSYVNFNQVMKKLGQTQYSSILINPNPRAHEDSTPYFQEIRIQGNPDSYYDVKIHKDDVRLFVEKWIEYKKTTSPFFGEKTIEDFLPEEYL